MVLGFPPRLFVIPVVLAGFALLSIQYARGALTSYKRDLCVAALLYGVGTVLLILSRQGVVDSGSTVSFGLDLLAALAMIGGMIALYHGIWRKFRGRPHEAAANA